MTLCSSGNNRFRQTLSQCAGANLSDGERRPVLGLGRLLGETGQERSIVELLRDAKRDFKNKKDCPNEEELAKTWPALREQLKQACSIGASQVRVPVPLEKPSEERPFDLTNFKFPDALSIPSPPQIPGGSSSQAGGASDPLRNPILSFPTKCSGGATTLASYRIFRFLTAAATPGSNRSG